MQAEMINTPGVKMLWFVILLSFCSCTVEHVNRGEVLIVANSSEAEVLDSGEHYIPFYKVIARLDISEQRLSENVTSLTSDNKQIELTTSIMFKPIRAEVIGLFKNYGLDYQNTLVIPELRAAVRQHVKLSENDSLNIQLLEQRVHQHLDTLLRKNILKR